MSKNEVKENKQELYCDNCPKPQKTRCQERKEEYKKGYAWLDDYIKINLGNTIYSGFGREILKQVNALKIYPHRHKRYRRKW